MKGLFLFENHFKHCVQNNNRVIARQIWQNSFNKLPHNKLVFLTSLIPPLPAAISSRQTGQKTTSLTTNPADMSQFNWKWNDSLTNHFKSTWNDFSTLFNIFQFHIYQQLRQNVAITWIGKSICMWLRNYIFISSIWAGVFTMTCSGKV